MRGNDAKGITEFMARKGPIPDYMLDETPARDKPLNNFSEIIFVAQSSFTRGPLQPPISDSHAAEALRGLTGVRSPNGNDCNFVRTVRLSSAPRKTSFP
jgi:hypothetical protein